MTSPHSISTSIPRERESSRAPARTYTPDPETDQAVIERMPLGRWGEADDAARIIAWLVSDEASWVTGQVINSDGGFRS